MSYAIFKSLHLIGVILLIGNVTVTSVWKVFADRTRNPVIIGFAQRMVTITDFAFTVGGIVFLCVGGFGATWIAGIAPFAGGWLVETELLFVASGAVWLFVLVPIQIRQARDARLFAGGSAIPASYWRASRAWLIWGIVATVPLVAAIAEMIAKVPLFFG